jgi:peroxiredoxin
MHQATEDLRNSVVMEGVVKVGDTAPDFELQNAAGNLIRLKDILAEGPLVLCFYRGKW